LLTLVEGFLSLEGESAAGLATAEVTAVAKAVSGTGEFTSEGVETPVESILATF